MALARIYRKLGQAAREEVQAYYASTTPTPR